MNNAKLDQLMTKIKRTLELGMQENNEEANCGGEWLISVKDDDGYEQFSISAAGPLEIVAEETESEHHLRFRIKIDLEQIPDGD